jgi:6-pyruvoyltetrahydropterin/6-carboxytetrahydropterin synthase
MTLPARTTVRPDLPHAVAVIGDGEYSFCAAHALTWPETFEPLHGHTFMVQLELGGALDATSGGIMDFGAIKRALRDVIKPLRRRTLLAADAPGVEHVVDGGQVRFGRGAKTYCLPIEDVVMLPIVNTTTEAIAWYLLDQLEPVLRRPGVAWARLRLAEAPDVAATVHRDLT